MLDIYLLVSRDNEHTRKSINSFIEIKTNSEINKYISVNKKLKNAINIKG